MKASTWENEKDSYTHFLTAGMKNLSEIYLFRVYLYIKASLSGSCLDAPIGRRTLKQDTRGQLSEVTRAHALTQ